MTANLTIDHLHVYASDPRATADSYVRLFGASQRGEKETVNGLRVVLDLSGVTLFVEQAPGDQMGVDHIGMATGNLDASLARIEAEGGRILVPARDMAPGLRIAFVEAPDGQRVEILQRGG